MRTAKLFTLAAVVTGMLSVPMLTQAQTVTNWVVFNDHVPGAGTAANVNPYNMRIGPGGRLTNLTAQAEYAAGEELAARVFITKSGTVDIQGTMAYPASGTPAYNLFNGIVDLANGPDPGTLFSLNVPGQVTFTFNHLNPTMRYVFRTTSSRGREGDAPDRWTMCSLVGATAFVDAHTAGVVTSNTYPSATLTSGQAAYNSGRNQAAGDVVGWDEINPGPDGSISIVAAQYTGPIPVGSGTANGPFGYGPVAFMLVEVGPITPVSIITQPAAETTVLQARPFSLSVQPGGTGPHIQWYKEGSGAISGAVYPTYSVANASLSDAGNYYVIVTNSFSSVTSSVAHVTVQQDTNRPVVLSVVGSASFDKISLQFNEVLDESTATDPVNYTVQDSSGNFVSVTEATLTNNGTLVILSTAPQQENTLYSITLLGVQDLSGNAADSTVTIPFRSWVVIPNINGLVFESYNAGTGTDVALLTNSPVFPNNPRDRYIMTAFDTRTVYPDDSHENFGARVRGLFIPPVTGSWRFFLRSDDASQLYLNPTGPSAAGKQLILEERGCCGNFDKYQSAPYFLQGGQGYYIEGLYKEGGGGDYLKVAARLNDGTIPPSAANGSVDPEAIPGGWIGYPAAPAGIGGPVTITQQPTNQEVLVNTMASFSVAASNPNELPLAYQWRKDGVDIPGATASTYSFRTSNGDNGSQISVAVSVIGSTTVSAPATVTVRADEILPTVVSVHSSRSMTNVVIKFSELVDEGTAEDQFSYSIPGFVVQTATLDADGTTVLLTLDHTQTLGATYEIQVQNVKDLAGNFMNPVTLPLRAFVISPGFLSFLAYNTGDPACGNNSVNLLRNHPSFPDHPSEQLYMTSFDTRTVYPNDSHEGFGGWIAGYFIPPASGNWIFYMSVDDDGEVWLNPNGEDPAGLTNIVSAPSCCQPLSAHASTPIPLVAGQRYALQALYKEGCGGDYLRVAAKLETDPTPPDSLSPISRDNIACLADPAGAVLTIAQQPVDQFSQAASGSDLYKETFNSGDGGYTVSNSSTPAPQVPWSYNSVNGSWTVNGSTDLNAPSWSALNSAPITVPRSGGITLSFNHRHSFEYDGTRWDGGQVRISVNGGAFTLVPTNAFSSNGYTGIITGNNIMNGQSAFNGDSAGYADGTFITSIASLGTFNAGDSITLQFLGAWDEYTRGNTPNWQIDSVTLVQDLLTEDFTSSNGGFTVVNSTGPAPEGPWVYSAANGNWTTDGSTSLNASSFSALNSPVLTISRGGGVTLTFKHRYSFEYDGTRWDGGQVRVSINGGAFTMIPASAFTANGYIGIITGNNVLSGQNAFNGDSPGYGSGALITSTASLGALNAGDTVAVQFLGAWDEGARGTLPNWVIDSVNVVQGGVRPVTFSVVAQGITPGVSNAVIAYQWQRDDGAGFANITGANGSSITFVPETSDAGDRFRVVLSMPGISPNVVSDIATLFLEGLTRPGLTITRSGSNAIISWPSAATGFVLEKSSSLSPASWSAVTETVTEANGTKSVTVAAGTGQTFYRLRK
jgi:hypothetical protein